MISEGIPADGAALFIVPFIQAVFSLECALRSLRKKSFQARGKYDVAICGGVITLMLIGTWVYCHVVQEPNECVASLVWYISRYGEETLTLLLVSAGLMLFSTIAIFIRLSVATTVDKQQRLAASRIVYYNVLGLVYLVGALIKGLADILTGIGLRHSILCLADSLSWKYQTGDDGDCGPQSVGPDGRTTTNIPQV
jgi:hypothetical protein